MGDKLHLLCNKHPLYDVNFVSDAPCVTNNPPPPPPMTVNAKNKELEERSEIIQFILFLVVEKRFAIFAHCIFSMSKDCR